MGLMVWVFAGSIVWQSKSWSILHEEYLIPHSNEKNNEEIKPAGVNGRKKVKYIFVFIWLALILLFAQSYFHLGAWLLPPQIPLQILLRSVLIILTWYFLVSPLLSSLIKKWLHHQHLKSQSDINQVTLMLPSTKYIFLRSWQISSSAKGLKRATTFCKIVLVNILR